MIEVPSEARRRIMQAVRAKDTKPELIVRQVLHPAGFRYRLHRKGLPGSPDLVFPSRRKVIFVHGCFWHRHDRVRGARTPKTNAEFWRAKIEALQDERRTSIDRFSRCRLDRRDGLGI